MSQSGRFLRTFLYDGFNEDEAHRKVFDGVMAHVAGAGRGSFNLRFAQPSRDGHPFMNRFYPTDIFPFTDVAQTDPKTGVRGGLLARVKPEHLPRLFYTNSSYEYWGRAASLVHTTVDGKGDADVPPTTRIYMFAGGQHGPAAFPPSVTIGQQPSNPNDYRWMMRSLLLAMDRWIRDGTAPPPSRYPRVDDGTLVTMDRWRFPALPAIGAGRAVEGVPGGLRAAVRDRGRHLAGSAACRRGVHHAGAASGRGWQRDGRAEDARGRGAPGHLHGLEPLQSEGRAAAVAIEHAGVVHPAAPHAARARA